MALPEIEALDQLVEKQSTLADPAERDRALAAIQSGLEQILSNVETYRGDARIQMQPPASERNSDN